MNTITDLNFSIVRNDDVVKIFEFFLNGEYYDFSTSEVRMDIEGETNYSLVGEINLNRVTFTIPHATNTTSGNLVYNIQETTSEGKIHTLAIGAINILPDVLITEE